MSEGIETVELGFRQLNSFATISASAVQLFKARHPDALIKIVRSHLEDAYQAMITKYVAVDLSTEREWVCFYPMTWWDAFKERWFPAWALKRWPAKYHHETFNAVAMYPDFKVLPEHITGRMVILCDHRARDGAKKEEE